MPETRKFDAGDTEGIQKLVRDALGETVRPVTPGEPRVAEEPQGSGDVNPGSYDTIDYVNFTTFPVKS